MTAPATIEKGAARATSPSRASHLSHGTERMSTTDLGTDVPVARTEHAPWWAIAFAALLLAVSFGQRRAGEDTARTRNPAAPESGCGRSADTPSEIPAQGWKDILLRVYHGISEDRILLVAAAKSAER